MRAVTGAGGAFVSVSDEEILVRSPCWRARQEFGEPAGVGWRCGSQAGVESGIIGRSETVAIIMTGNGLKRYPSAIRAAGNPLQFNPTWKSSKGRKYRSDSLMLLIAAKYESEKKFKMAKTRSVPNYDENALPRGGP